MEAFLISTGIVALAEIGDKTQLLAFILAAKFRKPWPINAGILAATIANHAFAGAVGAACAGRGFPRRDDRRGRSYRGVFARTSTPDSAGRNRRHDGKRAGASAPDAADGGF